MNDGDLQVEPPDDEERAASAQAPRAAADIPPPPQPTNDSPDGSVEGYSGVVPYRNKAALWGYYCGVFSIIPCFPLGLIALYLGIRGLKNVKRDPAVRGTAHAWIGILVGGGFGLLWLLMTLGMVGSIFAA